MSHLLHATIFAASLAGASLLSNCSAYGQSPRPTPFDPNFGVMNIWCSSYVDAIEGRKPAAQLTFFINLMAQQWNKFDEEMESAKVSTIGDVLDHQLYQMMIDAGQSQCKLHEKESVVYIAAKTYAMAYSFKYKISPQVIMMELERMNPQVVAAK